MPGAGATEFPGGTGKLLEAGSRIIIQIHYNVAQAKDTEPDASRVELSLADPTAKLKPVHDVPLAAPVEILCPGPYPSSPNDPCNREYALERSELRVVSNGIHLLCGTRPKDFTSRDVGDGRLSGKQLRPAGTRGWYCPGGGWPHAPPGPLHRDLLELSHS